MTNLLGGNNSPLPGKNMISNVLYKALTSGSIQVIIILYKKKNSNYLNLTKQIN